VYVTLLMLLMTEPDVPVRSRETIVSGSESASVSLSSTSITIGALIMVVAESSFATGAALVTFPGPPGSRSLEYLLQMEHSM